MQECTADQSPEEQAREPGSHVEPAGPGLHHPARSQFSLPFPRTRNCNPCTTCSLSPGSSAAIRQSFLFAFNVKLTSTCTHTHARAHAHTRTHSHGRCYCLASALSQNPKASAVLTDLRVDSRAGIFRLHPTAPDLTQAGTSFTCVVLS